MSSLSNLVGSDERWMAFLDNHREAIAAMDFFTVPTIAFGILYCFFVIAQNGGTVKPFGGSKMAPK
jgi:hypothetical protein